MVSVTIRTTEELNARLAELDALPASQVSFYTRYEESLILAEMKIAKQFNV